MEMQFSWEEWKKTLAKAVGAGQKMGLSAADLAQKAEKVGDYLSKQVDPANPQQKVLADLWKAGNDNEQKALASMIIKMVNGGTLH